MEHLRTALSYNDVVEGDVRQYLEKVMYDLCKVMIKHSLKMEKGIFF